MQEERPEILLFTILLFIAIFFYEYRRKQKKEKRESDLIKSLNLPDSFEVKFLYQYHNDKVYEYSDPGPFGVYRYINSSNQELLFTISLGGILNNSSSRVVTFPETVVLNKHNLHKHIRNVTIDCRSFDEAVNLHK